MVGDTTFRKFIGRKITGKGYFLELGKCMQLLLDLARALSAKSLYVGGSSSKKKADGVGVSFAIKGKASIMAEVKPSAEMRSC